MTLNFKLILNIFIGLLVFFFLSLFGCASIQQPTGGPKDSVAPKILKEDPKNFTLNFKEPEINIEFNEYFKLANAAKEISLSPDVSKQPEYKIKKKFLNIKFQDTLEANTTYTINFGKAIADYNEGNVLKNYMYVFSTGEKIDSLSISGNVINSQTKKPQLDATVFLLPLNRDTIFGKKRAQIFTNTDSLGNFKLNNLKENTYKIYVVYEKDGGDKIYNSATDEVGFLTNPIDLKKDTSGIQLQLFKEEPKIFKIIDRKIENTGRIVYTFNQKLAIPSLKILSPAELDNKRITEFSSTGDTAYLWTQELTFDSIQVAILNNSLAIDTTVIRRGKKEDYNKTIGIKDNVPSGKLKPGTDLQLTFASPVNTIDPKLIILLQDSVPVKGFRLERDTASTRKYVFKYAWKPEKNYDLSLAEGAVKGLYGGQNKVYTIKLTRDEEENYGNVVLKVSGTLKNKSYVLELLNNNGQVITSNIINADTIINYNMYAVGKYQLRVIYDDNKNGKWDTGDIKKRKQPENIWNSPTTITLRANWDLEEKLIIPPSE